MRVMPGPAADYSALREASCWLAGRPQRREQAPPGRPEQAPPGRQRALQRAPLQNAAPPEEPLPGASYCAGAMTTLLALHGTALLVWLPAIGNLVLALLAGLAALAGRRTLPALFWAALLVLLALLAVQAAAGLALVAGGARPRTALHLLYGVLVAVGAVVQYGLRPGGWLRRRVIGEPFREARVMALVCLTEGALILRAWMTGALGR